MSQSVKAEKLTSLHIKGDPLVLYNIWDAATAQAAERAGAKAIATGSHSVAGAQGFDDGEELPLEFLLAIVRRICCSTTLPVTVDFEGGYATSPEDVKVNVTKVIRAGAVGINFEDQRVGSDEIYPVAEQKERLAAAVEAGKSEAVSIVVNARTDIFLKADPQDHGDFIDETIARGAAYRLAGAKSYFVPGVVDLRLISKISSAVDLPVNVMMKPGAPTVEELAKAGVARISYGPFPFFDAVAAFEERARAVL